VQRCSCDQHHNLCFISDASQKVPIRRRLRFMEIIVNSERFNHTVLTWWNWPHTVRITQPHHQHTSCSQTKSPILQKPNIRRLFSPHGLSEAFHQSSLINPLVRYSDKAKNLSSQSLWGWARPIHFACKSCQRDVLWLKGKQRVKTALLVTCKSGLKIFQFLLSPVIRLELGFGFRIREQGLEMERPED
jgi:hypothetical protein